jgi:hypothetical protein
MALLQVNVYLLHCVNYSPKVPQGDSLDSWVEKSLS